MTGAEPATPAVELPADSHVHTQWSWDASAGDMVATCERAVAMGLPAVAFTEHVDITVARVPDAVVRSLSRIEPGHPLFSHLHDGVFTPPPFDAEGYLAMVEECRHRFRSLRILSGLEMGEPHQHGSALADLLSAGTFDRVLGSLHCVPDGDGFAEPPALYVDRDPASVVRAYLAEVAAVVATDARFEVLAHVDYPARWWPDTAAVPFRIDDFEEEFRHALAATAASGRALELNTRLSNVGTLLRWWTDVGGGAVSFGSDAHEPAALATRFTEARHLAEAHGFRPGAQPHELWGRG